MNTLSKTLMVIAGSVFITGLALGLIPVTIADYDCGSAFFYGKDITECSVFTDWANRRIWAFALLILGSALFISSVLFADSDGSF